MDSGNSGSLNTSSGDDEYDSRADHSIPSFLNPSLTHFGSSDQTHPDTNQLLPHHLFDLQPNPNNFLLNLDRSTLTRSDHHHHQQPYQLGLTSMSNIQQPLMFPSSSPIQLQPSQPQKETVLPTTATFSGGAGSSTQTAIVRSSKKRTRASRRAPTTVLTTDTSNFRAMVQEFTGIPAPPFSAASSSPFARRFDLFGSSSSAPLYPLVRPSAMKPPFSSSMFSNVMIDSTNIATSSFNYPTRNVLNMAFQVQSLPPNPSDTNTLNAVAGFNATSNKQPQSQSQPSLTFDHHHQDMNVGHVYGGGTASALVNSTEINAPTRGDQGTVESWIFPSE